jgi:hypothetical protein
MEHFPAIIPLRHPKVVARSWELRNKDLGDFHLMWRDLVYSLDPLGPYFLPLDVEHRQTFLDLIPIDRETHWPEINSKHHTSGLRMDDVEYSGLEDGVRVRETVEEIQPFLDRFY